jgi:hypothetical protein
MPRIIAKTYHTTGLMMKTRVLPNRVAAWVPDTRRYRDHGVRGVRGTVTDGGPYPMNRGTAEPLRPAGFLDVSD